MKWRVPAPQFATKATLPLPCCQRGRGPAASVESLQQTMNYGWNEKSQPGAQREYAKCRAITFVREPCFVPPSHAWGPKTPGCAWACPSLSPQGQDSLLPRDGGSEMPVIRLKWKACPCALWDPPGSSWGWIKLRGQEYPKRDRDILKGSGRS